MDAPPLIGWKQLSSPMRGRSDGGGGGGVVRGGGGGGGVVLMVLVVVVAAVVGDTVLRTLPTRWNTVGRSFFHQCRRVGVALDGGCAFLPVTPHPPLPTAF